MDIDFVRELWDADEVEYTDEAVRRMRERGVSRENIGEAIRNGSIVEERPHAEPFASCTIRGWAERVLAGVHIGPFPLNVACAVDDGLLIITLYWERGE